MRDNLTPESRRWAMSQVRSKNTSSEILVRSLLHRLGYRFRLHRRDLPGCPDIVLPKYRTVIFVHGCFWHQHPGCRKATIPEHNADYWAAKLKRNSQRDQQARMELANLGWKVVVIWGCEVGARKLDLLTEKLRNLLKETA